MEQSLYAGVYLSNSHHKDRLSTSRSWVAQIGRAGTIFKLGVFDSDKVAAAAFDVTARRTEAWRQRETRMNFPTLEEATAILGVKYQEKVERRIEQILESLRLIDPMAESRLRARRNAEMEPDDDAALGAIIQNLAADAATAKLRVKNALRAWKDRQTALAAELERYKLLAHERAAEIERLRGELEIVTSAAAAKIVMRPIAGSTSLVDLGPTDTPVELDIGPIDTPMDTPIELGGL